MSDFSKRYLKKRGLSWTERNILRLINVAFDVIRPNSLYVREFYLLFYLLAVHYFPLKKGLFVLPQLKLKLPRSRRKNLQ